DFVDVILISILVYNTGGQTSPWFLIYLFPIISGSKHFESAGSIGLGAISVVIFFLIISHQSGVYGLDINSAILKVASVGLLAVLVGNLSKRVDEREKKLIAAERIVHNATLSTRDLSHTFTLILKNAMELTDSDRGEIVLAEKDHSKSSVRAGE